jgi:carbonic anhydrase
MTQGTVHTSACQCCGDLLRARFDRRLFLKFGGAAGISAMLPSFAMAATGNYEAMVVSCMDPRMQEPVHRYTTKRRLTGKFSTFIVAGAAIGIVAPAFKDWHKTYWDNVGASVQLHNIKKVIVVNHRDCGAAKIAYGDAKVATRQIETETHRETMMEFRKEMKERLPQLAVETGLMDLKGKIETFS